MAAMLLALSLLVAPTPSYAQGTAPVGASSLSVPPLDMNTCPVTHPVKGNKAGHQASRPADPIYQVPGSRYYAATDPEECFATAEDAEAAGYRVPLW
jgi:hypothetical protein